MIISLGDLRKRDPGLLQEIADITVPYSIPIMYPSKAKINAEIPFGGSGSLSIIGKRYGILTNAHVARIVRNEDPNHVYLPFLYPKPGLLPIRILKIVSLPEIDNEGIDMAFIELNATSVAEISKELNKKFWNLDFSCADYLQGKLNVKEPNLHNYLWLTHGYSFAKRELRSDGKGNKYWDYPYGGPYFLAPNNIKNTFYKYPELQIEFQLDKVSSLVDREISQDAKPESFNGMSGAAVWRIEVGVNRELQINIAGIATEEKYGKNYDVDEIIFYGTDALYKSFYPFCLANL